VDRSRIYDTYPVSLVVDELGKFQVIGVGGFHHDQGCRLDVLVEPGIKLFETF
jgi:hypothetical protein